MPPFFSGVIGISSDTVCQDVYREHPHPPILWISCTRVYPHALALVFRNRYQSAVGAQLSINSNPTVTLPWNHQL